MYARGIHATTLDDVREASGTSKSQLYRNFDSKDDLVMSVVALQSKATIVREAARLGSLNSFEGLVTWRDAIVQANDAQGSAHGCALSSMANELSAENDAARSALSVTFSEWEGLISDVLVRMQENGTLSDDAAPAAFATGLMAALQGGYLMAQTTRDVGPLEIALDMALSHIKTFLIVQDLPLSSTN
jgi:AcrR family transcriptional regulator